MTRKIFTLLGIALGIVSCQKNTSQYVINGEIPSDIKGKVYLMQYKNREFIPVDSTEISQGKFHFKGSTNEPMVYTLQLNSLRKRTFFFLENAPIEVKLNAEWDIEYITGSENIRFFRECQQLNKDKALNVEHLLQTHNNSPVTAYFLATKSYLYEYQSLKSLREKLSNSLNTYTYVVELDNLIEQLEKLQPGNPAPDIIAQTPQGTTIRLSDLKGKIVLVDFWASWCPDCRKENPLLVQLYNQYKDRNFTILGISLDSDYQSWLKAIEKDRLTWHHGLVEGNWKADAPQTYAIRWLPTSILIDKNGIIVSRTIHSSELVPHIEKLYE